MPEHHFHLRLLAGPDRDNTADNGSTELETEGTESNTPRPDNFPLSTARTGAVRPGALARRHTIVAEGKPDIEGTSARVFHGETSRWNPEELLVAALAQCHFLSFVYLAGLAQIEIRDVEIDATGTLLVEDSGAGQMVRVELRPRVEVPISQRDVAQALHHDAHEACFIARSVNFEVAVIAQTISPT